jgi:putative peptide zinc metalloprotease protein
MSDNLFSPSWYRVAHLRPRLRSHLQIHRHEYRGRVWYVLQDQIGGRSHRFTPTAYRLIGLMDGKQTIDTLWQELNSEAGDDAPTQDDVIRLLGQLHAADALLTDATPDSQEAFRRRRRLDRMKLKQKLWTPLVVRVPILDPERFLERTYPYVRHLFGLAGAIIWPIVVGFAAILAAVHWNEITDDLFDRALTPANLVLLWFVYPVVKSLHELGHGYAVKKSGGEVHEIGIMFLVLIPVPYVDASSAWGFRDKSQRMLVGAAGIAVELFLGSIALFVWLTVSPGTVSAIAYNVMIISGVSTLLFNGNPLLRFDGYYVFSDAIEIPNLANRSNKYLGYLIQRYLYGVTDAESPADSKGERIWMGVYGVAAFVYRMFIMFAIMLYVGGKFFAIGVLLALWAVVTMIFVPLGKSTSFLLTSPGLRGQRGRTLSVTAAILAAIVLLLFVIPAPLWTRAQGVTWPPETSMVRAATDGFIVKIAAPSGSQVSKGQVLIEARDPFIEARVKVLEANKRELQSQLTASRVMDRVQMAIIREALDAAEESLRIVSEKAEKLVIHSPRDGIFIVPQQEDLPDRFARQGQILAYVISPQDPVRLRVVVPQDDISLVRERMRGVAVLPARWSSDAIDASILREVPGGTTILPSPALGLAGGGAIPIDPRDPDGRTTLERVFEFEIQLPSENSAEFIGQRMNVRFDHGYEPIGLQMYRAFRQLLLRRFSV